MDKVTAAVATAMKEISNPANVAGAVPVGERKRIPMSVPQPRLSTTPIPGFRQYWFLEKNIARAKQAGYEFVDDKEVIINQSNVSMDKEVSGNSDLGSNISVVAGTGETGKPERLVLMKIKEEWFNEDQQALAARNAAILSGIFKDDKVLHEPSATAEDKGQVYVKKALFQRPLKRQV